MDPGPSQPSPFKPLDFGGPSTSAPTARRIHPAALPVDELLSRCELGKSRSSGPGGQHRNKVETMVTITHTPTGIAAHAGERRSAAENRKVAITRLRLSLATEVRAPVPPGDPRSALWASRCRAGRIACSPRHEDYPAMLAEALDVVHASRLDEKKAAARLGCTPSQLVKLVGSHPAALARWNRDRAAAGLHPLR